MQMLCRRKSVLSGRKMSAAKMVARNLRVYYPLYAGGSTCGQFATYYITINL